MLNLILISITLFTISALGIGVVFHNPEKRSNRCFFFLIFWVIVWLASNYLEHEFSSLKWAQWMLRIDFASASMLAYSFFIFCFSFQSFHFIDSSKTRKVLIFIPSLALAALSFSDLIIKNPQFTAQGLDFEPGFLFPVYISYMFLYIGAGVGDLVVKYKRGKGINRIQTLYILLGLSISACIALVINLFLQGVIPVRFFRIGNYSIIFFVVFSTYAILEHHLFNIKVIAAELFTALLCLVLFINIFTYQSLVQLILNIVLFLGAVVFGILLIRSVLREIEARGKLRKAYKELKKLDDAKSEFISIASHQLRTPLAVIKGYISMILGGSYGKLSSKMKEPIRKVSQSNNRLINLVNDLLNISRIETGKMEFTPERISIQEVVSSVVEELKIKADKKGIYLRYKSPKHLPEIMADSSKIKDVMMNLVDNAIKYTEKGGVTVSTRLKQALGGDKIMVKVKDTGEGLTQEELSHLFKKFSRGKAGDRLNPKGAGLGLYVARRYVEMHDGKIWAESEGKGKGTSFFVELPVK